MDLYLSLLCDFQCASGSWRRLNALGLDAVSSTLFRSPALGLRDTLLQALGRLAKWVRGMCDRS